MLNMISQCVIFIIIFTLSTYAGQKLHDSEVFSPKAIGREKNKDFKKANILNHFDVAEKRKSVGSRVKRRSGSAPEEECPTRSDCITKENTCSPGASCELERYECGINCPEQETKVGCELNNCTEIYSCTDNPGQHVSLDLTNNDLVVLPDNVFNGLSELSYLILSNNMVTFLPDNVFNGLSELSYLILSNNMVTVLPDNVFSGLSELQTLYLSNNMVTFLPDSVFIGLSELIRLDLSNNMVKVLPDNVFSGLSELSYLILSNNMVTFLPDNMFSGLSKLYGIFLSNNMVTFLPDNVFSRLSDLNRLDLSNNMITVLPYNVFSGLSGLMFLSLGNNALTHLPEGTFINNSKLSVLYIMGNKIEVMKTMFKGLDNLTRIMTDNAFVCCVKPKSVTDNNCIETNKPIEECFHGTCETKGDAISSCHTLISSRVLRACLWIIGICALIGNLIVIFYRLFLDRDNMTKSYCLFTFNLAISDLLMGVYLLIIGFVDVHYNGIYAWNDQNWRNSFLCTTAGVLSSVSSEMSTFLILLVTIDRVIVIVFPLSRLSSRSISWKQALIVSVSLWIVSITLAVIPVIPLVAVQSYFKGKFYSQSGVCLALPLTSEEWPGTEYSFAVFVGLNSIVFGVIVIGQICIIKSMRTSSRRITSSQNRQREMTVAFTLFFVVATDFCCWFPIGVMGVVSRCGVEIPDGVYAWVMVFVLPINAAINPFLYTATAVWRKRRKVPTAMTPPIRLQHQPAAINMDWTK